MRNKEDIIRHPWNIGVFLKFQTKLLLTKSNLPEHLDDPIIHDRKVELKKKSLVSFSIDTSVS